MIVLGMADHYAARNSAMALAWSARQPQALAKQAQGLLDTDPAQAEYLLRQAVQANPADGRIAMALAQVWAKQGRVQQAAALAEMAGRLAPLRSSVQLRLAAFWLQQGRLDEALARLSVALRLRADLRSSLYPALLELAEDSRTRPVFWSVLKEAPDWREDFFRYVANHAASLELVRELYYAQRRLRRLPSPEQQRDYMARLQREGQWTELYFTWLNSLEARQLEGLGYLYNGGFELPLGQRGFDWQAPRIKGVRVQPESTYGITGAKALKLAFQGQRIKFRHVYQYLLLPAGHYRLQGRVKPEGLQVERGVRWEIACADDTGLGSSESFSGSAPWRTFTAEFSVPAGRCPAQILRLVLIGRAALDFEARGTLWFDDLAIERID